MKKAMLGILVVGILPSMANAALITYFLSLQDKNGVPTAGSYSVYASVTGGSQGLALFSVSITGATTAQNFSPKASFTDGTGNNPAMVSGFTFGRAATNDGPSPQGGTSFTFGGSQDTVAFSADPSSELLIGGMGQQDDKFANHIPAGFDAVDSATPDIGSNPGNTPVGGSWRNLMLIGTGTWNPSHIPDFSTTKGIFGNVFTNVSTGATQAGMISLSHFTPEPASLGLLAVASISWGLSRRGRRYAASSAGAVSRSGARKRDREFQHGGTVAQ